MFNRFSFTLNLNLLSENLINIKENQQIVITSSNYHCKIRSPAHVSSWSVFFVHKHHHKVRICHVMRSTKGALDHNIQQIHDEIRAYWTPIIDVCVLVCNSPFFSSFSCIWHSIMKEFYRSIDWIVLFLRSIQIDTDLEWHLLISGSC